ncbi:hypothetical protein NW768_004903 [Fusarium equiseti]|uniref:Uncharacterized protein n=1 Tax=Fusarium equiseti TaxID=61235 RepID=A0ABQ8RHG3_FUSEQ|nr:hypothetical protein NW768_004903 [Fusarium equiseti]
MSSSSDQQPKIERVSDEQQEADYKRAEEYRKYAEAENAAKFAAQIKREGKDSNPPQRTVGEGGWRRKTDT